jgi:hypothetical protein
MLYPEAASRAGGHHDLAFLLHGRYPEWAIPQDDSLDTLWANLEAEVSAHPGDVILSSENFYLYPAPKALARRMEASEPFRRFRVQVVAYVRPQEATVESWYNQAVKAQGVSAAFPDFVRDISPMWDYEQGLAPWAETFGEKNILVRRYNPESQKDWDICRDFQELLPAGTVSKDGSGERTNSRLNRDVLEFQRIINRLPLPIVEKRTFHKQLIALSARSELGGIFDDSPLMTATERQDIRSLFTPSNTRVARRYLGEETLFPPVPEREGEGRTYSGLDPEKIVMIMGWLLLNREKE